MSERLDRLEALAETILLAIQKQQENRDADKAEFRESIQDIVSMIGTLGETSDRQLALIQEMQSEVKGLQTENRRILERLEAHFANGHGGES